MSECTWQRNLKSTRKSRIHLMLKVLTCDEKVNKLHLDVSGKSPRQSKRQRKIAQSEVA